MKDDDGNLNRESLRHIRLRPSIHPAVRGRVRNGIGPAPAFPRAGGVGDSGKSLGINRKEAITGLNELSRRFAYTPVLFCVRLNSDCFPTWLVLIFRNPPRTLWDGLLCLVFSRGYGDFFS